MENNLSTDHIAGASKRYRAKMKQENRCGQCGKPLEYNRLTKFRCLKCTKLRADYDKRNKEKINQYLKDYRNKWKLLVFEYYGNKCACCGESHPEFLQIDHINNDGADHRRNKKGFSSSWIYKWIVDNNYPDNLQLLCANCNWAKGIYGYCPHSKEL